MEKMTKREVSVLVDFLKEHREQLSRDGSNDMTEKETELANMLNANILEEDKRIYQNNTLLQYFINKLKKSLN